jgi:hypothetical protein
LGWAFNDLPELPTDNNPEETGGGGAQLGGDDAISATTANSAEDAGGVETAEHVDSFIKQPSVGAST